MPLDYFICAGEYSGDLLGADLVDEMRVALPNMKPFGVAGPNMLNAGVDAIASTNDLSVMGLFEVARKLPDLRTLEKNILDEIERRGCKLALLIDFPGFHLRLAEKLKQRGVKVVQYVAPKIWAWGEGRATRLKRDFDLVLGILPFEENFFRTKGIPYQYVGSPLKDRVSSMHIEREELGFHPSDILIAMLPGSRQSELRRIMPRLNQIRDVVAQNLPRAKFLVPLAPGIDEEKISKLLPGVDIKDSFHFVPRQSLEIMASADAAVVASGTATLECALVGTPMAVVYVMNPLTFSIAKKIVGKKIRYISLVNLMANREVVHEYIQNFHSSQVAEDIIGLICNERKRSEMKDALTGVANGLTPNASRVASEAIAQLVS